MSQALSPKSPRKGKYVNYRVIFLDDLVHAFPCPVKSNGQVLWDAVIQHLSLLESDYFDLMYQDESGQTCWLDRDKQISKQLANPDVPLTFCVKFYTPDPGLLEDELTRYLFALQIKRDLTTGVMPCSENTAALLSSYIAQAEIGDFLVDEYTDHTYLSTMTFVPHQTTQLEQKIMEYHRQHIGESPAEADLNLLDTARKVEMYGIRLHNAKDHEQVSLSLAVAHMGVLVFQTNTKINTFSWAKIRKLSFKRKKFLIKLHPDSYGFYKDTVEFFLETRNDCKAFWKKCIEHHAFFRCQTVRKVPRNRTRVVSRGSSFRYSGRTQKQLVEYVRENIVKRPQFERSTSGRISSRSASVTPKINAKTAIHNSSDIHNSTASSGSHILDPMIDNHVSPTRVEMAEVHSDSSMSGSRSLGSPKLEHGLVISESMDSANHKTDDEMRYEDQVNMKREAEDKVSSPTNHQNPSSPYTSFHAGNRKFSAPVLGLKDLPESIEEEHRMSRSSEVENIPESINEEEHNALTNNRHSLTRSASEATTNRLQHVETENHEESPSPPPPPPPPIFEEDYIPTPPSPLSEHNMSMLSSSNMGMSPNMSGLSRMEDGDEDSKRKLKRHIEDEANYIAKELLMTERTYKKDLEVVRVRHTGDDAYYIAKELLMTERTYKKDLEVVSVWFRNAVSGDDEILNSLTELLFSYLDPIYEFHVGFLKKVDLRIQQWEGKVPVPADENCKKIGDLVLDAVVVFEELYQNYLNREQEMLTEIDQKMKTNKKFEEMYKEFESQKVCYLPLNTFFLKPGQRLLHYKLLLEKLIKFYPSANFDLTDCREALAKILEITTAFQDKMRKLENLQKLMELQRDLVGIDSLVNLDRMFIREGCLQKYSRKGYQQRMFFLFSDMLVYTSRTASSLLQFKVHGQLALKGMIVEESEQSKMAIQFCFAIYAGNKYILVAASSQEEKDKWIEDLNEAIAHAKNQKDDKQNYPSLKSSASSSENVDGEQMSEKPAVPVPEKQIQHRANTTMHVCWHRNTSVSMRDHSKATKNQLSGYLLRKFKNSNGWQKLWVVFTNFCLFFYKSFQDDFPLASLPLLGYAVSTPEEEDDIHKDHVFKLQFKNHVYFFRAESDYTFSRWMEVINSATHNARRVRIFSRLESEQH